MAARNTGDGRNRGGSRNRANQRGNANPRGGNHQGWQRSGQDARQNYDRRQGYDPRGDDSRQNNWWNGDADQFNPPEQPYRMSRPDRPDRPDRPRADSSGPTAQSDDSESSTRSASSGSQPDAATNVTGRLVYLFALMRQSEAYMRRDRGGRGVMEGQGSVLHMLALHSPIAQKELSYLLGIRPQSLGELLGKLEESGQISRHPDPGDRRAQVVEITARGRAADSDRPAAPGDPFAVLDPDQQREFVTLLDQVIDGLEASIPGGIDRHLQTMRRVWVDNDGWNPEAGPSFGPYQGRGPGFGWPGGRGRRRN